MLERMIGKSLWRHGITEFKGGCRKSMDKLIIYETDRAQYAVRPMSWAGIWNEKEQIKESLNYLALFIEKEDAERFVVWKEAEEQGKLLKLPCAEVYKSSGDYVFYIFEDEIVECINCGVQIEADGNIVFTLATNEKIFPYREPDSEHDLSPEDWCEEAITLSVCEWGKTVFITHESAEAALKEMSKE